MPEDPGVKLEELKEDLKSKETELTKTTKERDTLKGDIAVLGKIVDEIKQVLNAYKQALQNIQKEKDDIEAYSKTKKSMIEAALKGRKDAVEDEINKIDEGIKEIENEVDKLKKDVENSKSNFSKTKQDLEDHVRAYDSLKNLQKTLSDNVKELKSLKDLIEKEEDKNKTANMYVLFIELERLLEQTNTSMKTDDELKSDLYETWTQLDAAKNAIREKEEKLKMAQAQLENKTKELELAIKNRRQNILTKTAEL